MYVYFTFLDPPFLTIYHSVLSLLIWKARSLSSTGDFIRMYSIGNDLILCHLHTEGLDYILFCFSG